MRRRYKENHRPRKPPSTSTQPESSIITHSSEENTTAMTAPAPTPRELTELLQVNKTIIGHLFHASRWDNMSSEERKAGLQILTLTAETALKLSEIAHVEVLGRNGYVSGGAKEELLAYAEREKTRHEMAKIAAETEKLKLETEKFKAETAVAAAQEERWRVEVLRLKAESAYNEYLGSGTT